MGFYGGVIPPDTMTEYINQIGEVPVGKVYEKVVTEEGIVQKGDIVVWSDPDAGIRNEEIIESLFIGYVQKIYKRDNPELGLTCPIGRVEIDRNLKAISGKEINLDRDEASMKFVENFLNSNYDKYIVVERTRNGDIEVSGE